MDSDVELIDEDRLEPDLEQVIEPDQENVDRLSENGDHHSEAEEAPVRIDPSKEKKVKIVKNPRLTLNPARLTGPRGIQIIEESFKDFVFLGKGYEKEDLDMVMKKLEHWAHRLFPKFQFDDCIDKIATLGKKKEVSNHIRKIRLDMLYTEPDINDDNRDDDMDDVESAPIIDEFDQLLNEQIALARSTPASSKFTSFVATTDQTPRNQENINTHVSTAMDESATDISAEQRERMLKNRILAEQRRLARMKVSAEQNNSMDTDVQISQNIDVCQ